jgi:RNA polymerase sigma-70 factor, ECF subfamily
MQQPGDEALLAGLAAGDPRAFESLYDRFGGRLYTTARGMLDHPQDAEDAVQEVFVALVRSRQRLVQVVDLNAYLFAALRRAAGRCAARRRRYPPLSGASLRDAPARQAVEDCRAAEVRRAMAALPRRQREVLALKIDGQLTFTEIARVMGTSANTAASRYRYALEKLRRLLKRE